jgi:hypothetical protein
MKVIIVGGFKAKGISRHAITRHAFDCGSEMTDRWRKYEPNKTTKINSDDHKSAANNQP